MRTCGWKNDAIVLVFFAASVVAGFFLMTMFELIDKLSSLDFLSKVSLSPSASPSCSRLLMRRGNPLILEVRQHNVCQPNFAPPRLF
jgi:hypothetical protein